MTRDAWAMADVPAANDDSPRAVKLRYTAVPASFADDRATIMRLWDSGLARHERAEAKLQWYYKRNPEGVPRSLFLRAEGSPRPVGVAAMSRRRMRLGSESLAAGFILDFVVEPEHRSFFPALLLQKELLRQGKEDHTVVFGMPGERAEAVMRRAGYKIVGQMVRSVRVLRSRDLLSRFLPGWLSAILGPAIDHTLLMTASLHGLLNPGYAWEWRDRPDADFDALWERVAPSDTLIGVRDGTFLTWRFVESPLHTYRFFVVLTKKDRRLVAYAVCHVDADAMLVADFLVDPGAPGAGRRLWLDLSREAYRKGHRRLSVEFLGAEAVRRDMLALGMVNREGRPLYAAFENRPALSSPSNWYLTYADVDG
jgi:hypothetical protein